MSTPSLREDLLSQLPAVELLVNLGWSYLTPTEALSLHRQQLEALHERKRGLMEKLLTREVRVKP